MGDAHKQFEHHKGKRRHDELQLDKASPTPRDDGDDRCSEWPHVSDYDGRGLLQDFVQGNGTDEYGPDEVARYQWNSVTPNGFPVVTAVNAACVGAEEKPDCREHCGDSGARMIDVYGEIG